MRYLKLLLLSIIFFFLLLTGVGLLFPASVHISRAIDLPGQRRSDLMQLMEDPSFRRCWQDSSEAGTGTIRRASDSSFTIDSEQKTTLHWVFHGAEGMVTIQGRIDVELGWLPWQRFQSLLLEPRYGAWMEKELERFRRCLNAAQLVSTYP